MCKICIQSLFRNENKSNIRYNQCSADLTQLKQSLIWLQDVDSTSLSQSKSGKYYISLCCKVEDVPQFEPTGKQVGIDLGLKDFLITSDGLKFDNQKFLLK